MALAMVTVVGWMLNVSEPHQFPVRAKPQITSSAMKAMSCSASTACTFSK